MNKKMVRVLALGLGMAATVFVTTACFLAGHRPEVPQELLDK